MIDKYAQEAYLAVLGRSGDWLRKEQRMFNEKINKFSRDELAALKRENARLRHLAYRDPLTGLGNRRAFDLALGQAIARSARQRRPMALILTDLNDLKGWNDTFGHIVGDRALRALARVLRSLRADDECFRASDRADEFAILLHITRKEDDPITLDFARASAHLVVNRMINALHRPRVVACGSQFPVSASFGGVVLIPTRGTKPQEVMQAADEQLLRTKGLKPPPTHPWSPRRTSAAFVEVFTPPA